MCYKVTKYRCNNKTTFWSTFWKNTCHIYTIIGYSWRYLFVFLSNYFVLETLVIFPRYYYLLLTGLSVQGAKYTNLPHFARDLYWPIFSHVYDSVWLGTGDDCPANERVLRTQNLNQCFCVTSDPARPSCRHQLVHSYTPGHPVSWRHHQHSNTGASPGAFTSSNVWIVVLQFLKLFIVIHRRFLFKNTNININLIKITIV